MKVLIISACVLYCVVAVGVFAMHMLPATFGLALLRSALWPVWFAGGLRGTPMPMD